MALRVFVVGVLCFLAPLSFAATPPEVSASKLTNRVYSVADLVVPIGAPGKEPIRTIEKKLIQLIESTIHPCSWSSVGGVGTVEYYPIGMALVVKQTPSVQEEIQDLLAALRRLQDVEVTVEMRFVTVPEEFFETLGVDFGGSKTPGMAVLDDTQVQVLLQGVQSNPGANVMQAPKVTMFNGQDAKVDLTEQQAFVVGVDFEEKDGKKVPVPRTKSVKTGLEISLLPTVTPDRKTVTLQLGVHMGRMDPPGLTCCSNQPRFSKVSLEKTLKLPDGATAMLTGWTRQREVRHEISPPILGKIPYLSRIFKNISYGKELEHTIVLVTPRILVRQEEEEKVYPVEQTEEIESKPAPACAKRTAAEVMYVNKRSFELTYELADLGPSKVQSVEVWVRRGGCKDRNISRTWERYPEEVRPTGSVPVTVKSEGRYGFTLVPRNGLGLRGPTPIGEEEPQVEVVVDETKPQLELYAAIITGRHPEGKAAFSWKASDNRKLRDRPVSLYWSEEKTGPWRRIADGLDDAGMVECSQKELPFQFYLRATATDEAGNVAEVITPERVKIDTKVPTIRNVKVKAREWVTSY